VVAWNRQQLAGSKRLVKDCGLTNSQLTFAESSSKQKSVLFNVESSDPSSAWHCSKPGFEKSEIDVLKPKLAFKLKLSSCCN